MQVSTKELKCKESSFLSFEGNAGKPSLAMVTKKAETLGLIIKHNFSASLLLFVTSRLTTLKLYIFWDSILLRCL